MALAGVGAKSVQHHGLGIYAHPRGLRRHGVAMEGIGKERRSAKQLASGRGAEEQQSTVEGAPFQPQPPFFDEINGSHFIALPKQHLVSSERSSFKRVLVERQHTHIRTLAAEECGLTLEHGATSCPRFCALAVVAEFASSTRSR